MIPDALWRFAWCRLLLDHRLDVGAERPLSGSTIRQLVAGVVDEQLLAGLVVDVHAHLGALPPAVEMVAELAVLIAVGVRVQVFRRTPNYSFNASGLG